MGQQSDCRCEHRFIETRVGPYAHTNGARVCCLCDHAEVRDSRTGKWIDITDVTPGSSVKSPFAAA